MGRTFAQPAVLCPSPLTHSQSASRGRFGSRIPRYAFRVTRNWDLEIDEEEAEDLLQTIQQELRRRDRGNAVRLEISGEVLQGSVARLCKALRASRGL